MADRADRASDDPAPRRRGRAQTGRHHLLPGRSRRRPQGLQPGRGARPRADALDPEAPVRGGLPGQRQDRHLVRIRRTRGAVPARDHRRLLRPRVVADRNSGNSRRRDRGRRRRHNTHRGSLFMRRPQCAAGFVAVMAMTILAAIPATALSATSTTSAKASDIREVPLSKKYSTANLGLNSARARSFAAPAAASPPPVGTVRQWLGLDDFNGALYRKDYTLRGVGNKIEVWVANDTAFPAGDCRAQIPGTTTVTQVQAQELADQFDDNMFPKDAAAFSVPPDRDGSGNVVSGVDPSGDGDKIMTLVDNVRD